MNASTPELTIGKLYKNRAPKSAAPQKYRLLDLSDDGLALLQHIKSGMIFTAHGVKLWPGGLISWERSSDAYMPGARSEAEP